MFREPEQIENYNISIVAKKRHKHVFSRVSFQLVEHVLSAFWLTQHYKTAREICREAGRMLTEHYKLREKCT
jgi:hypothetical protein